MRKKILIVDDDMMMRAIIEIYLEGQGFEIVASASNAKEALETIEKNKLDLIIIDIHLKSDISGPELAQKVNEKYDIPIIFISADPDEESIKQSINPNIYGYLQKPLHKNNLRSTIYFALAKHNLKNKDNAK